MEKAQGNAGDLEQGYLACEGLNLNSTDHGSLKPSQQLAGSDFS
jgi:hypothetical protein